MALFRLALAALFMLLGCTIMNPSVTKGTASFGCLESKVICLFIALVLRIRRDGPAILSQSTLLPLLSTLWFYCIVMLALSAVLSSVNGSLYRFCIVHTHSLSFHCT